MACRILLWVYKAELFLVAHLTYENHWGQLHTKIRTFVFLGHPTQHLLISFIFFNQQGRLNKAGVRLQAAPRACCSSTASLPGKEFCSIYEGSHIIQQYRHQHISNTYCYIFIRDWCLGLADNGQPLKRFFAQILLPFCLFYSIGY